MYIEKNENSFEDIISPTLFNKVNECLNKIDGFDFDIFELDEIIQRKSLYYVSNEIFSVLNFYEDLIPETTFRSFIETITDGYSRSVSYHNDLHASDVLQTCYCIMERGSVYYNCALTELDYISILLSSICHDYKHPGIGNSYLINSVHDIALTFNGNYCLIKTR